MTKILILEDDDFIRQQLAGILQEKGYLVVEAASGKCTSHVATTGLTFPI